MNNQPQRIYEAINNRQLDIYHFHDTNNIFLNTLYSQMKTVIAKGGVGKVYLVEKGKYIVKESAPCYYDVPQLIPYCDDIKKLIDGIPIILIPSGNTYPVKQDTGNQLPKYRYILPNLLSEAVIGMIFSSSHISVHLGGILGTFILLDKDKPSVYNIMNTYTPIERNNKLNPVFSKPVDYLYLLFQVSTALLDTQEKYRFTHYDLHLGNVLLDKWPEDKNNIIYRIPGRTISIFKNKCPFIAKITDYGLSRMETDHTLVTPSITNYPEATFGEFNPSYDIISFLGSTLFDFRTRSLFFPLLTKDLDFYFIILNFVLWMFNETEIKIMQKTIEEYARVSLLIGKKYYKLNNKGEVYFRPASFDKNLVKYMNIKSMSQIVTYLSNILLKFNYATLTNDDHIVSYSKWDDIVPFTISPGIMKIDDGIRVQNYHVVFSSPPNNYNFTLDKKQIETCPFQEHYLTAIFIRKNTSGYRFSTQGYMIDPINYMRMNKLFGFAINGSYFNIGKDYLPIGPYKDSRGVQEYYPIPEKYKDAYGYLCLRDTKALITRDFKEAIKYDYFMSTGPFLIEKQKIVFKEYEERFACINVEELVPPITVLNSTDREATISGYFNYFIEGNSCYRDYVPRPLILPKCNKIAPGELSHADNPNPRSAVCVLKNGDVIFLTIEGRGERGVGIDLGTLARSIKKTFPTVVTAINLDGGRSSNLAWRRPQDPSTVYIANPNHLYAYPVGNIITFTKSS